MNDITQEEASEEGERPVAIEELSVYRACEQIADGRAKRGVRYSVALVLSLLLLGKLAGMTTPEAIADWVRLRGEWLRRVFPLSRANFPCASTYRNVLRVLDAEQVNQVLSSLLIRAAAAKRCGEEPGRLVGQVEREEHVHVA